MEPTVVVSQGGRGDVPVWQWAVLAAGVALLLAGGFGYLAGSQVYASSLEPDVSAGGTTYSAPGVDLKAGTYTVRLKVRHNDCRTLMNRHAYTLQLAELPSMRFTGAMSHGTTTKKRLGSSTRRKVRRPEADDSLVLKLPQAGRFGVRIELDEPLRDKLQLRIKTAPFDPRLPLFAGVVVLVIGVAVGDGLRAKLLGLASRR